jgi:hypothetical protein
VARVELQPLESESPVHVEISPARLLELALQAGETVHVAARKVHVFVPDYVI